MQLMIDFFMNDRSSDGNVTAQKMKFSIKDFFSKCEQIRRRLGIWSHLLKKSFVQCVMLNDLSTDEQRRLNANIILKADNVIDKVLGDTKTIIGGSKLYQKVLPMFSLPPKKAFAILA